MGVVEIHSMIPSKDANCGRSGMVKDANQRRYSRKCLT